MPTASTITEAEFIRQVLDLARWCGWRSAHFRPGKTGRKDRNGKDVWVTAVQGDGKGFPDLVLVKTRVIAAELKVGRNRTTAEQDDWLKAFAAAGIATFVWTPADWNEIQDVLQGADQ